MYRQRAGTLVPGGCHAPASFRASLTFRRRISTTCSMAAPSKLILLLMLLPCFNTSPTAPFCPTRSAPFKCPNNMELVVTRSWSFASYLCDRKGLVGTGVPPATQDFLYTDCVDGGTRDAVSLSP